MPRNDARAGLDALVELGFGPDACLMRDPRLFVDARFLAALTVEFEHELGPEESARSLFQIGLLHGLRDAQRASGVLFEGALGTPGGSDMRATPLAIRFEGCGEADAGVALAGSWPERHEANARRALCGPMPVPCCYLSAGYTSGWLSGTMERDIIALERECHACGGDSGCRFEARELTWWETHDPRRIEAFLGPIGMSTYRQVAASTLERETRPHGDDDGLEPISNDSGFDAAAPVVHIWGPVMVLPFTGPDEALQAVDLLSRDPSTGEVRAVVLDLRQTILDDAFGSAALEQVLEVIELWAPRR